MSKTLVQFGAGNIGRSFIGQLFARAGYEVVFVDVDERIITELNRRGEYIVVVKADGREDEYLRIQGVRGILAGDRQAVVDAIAGADYVATAVGARALPKVAPALAAAAIARAGSSYDVIIAENVRGAAGILQAAIEESLARLGASDGVALPGLVETSIGKMVPIMSDRDRAADPLLVFAEPYNTLIVDANAFTGPLPQVADLKPVESIDAYVDRKLFIHNLGHAACAYFGYRRDPSMTYVWQAMADDEVRSATREAMQEAACGLLRRYPAVFDKPVLDDHIDDLLSRFANSALGDTIYRVGRDLKRKLSRDDRLVGALRLCVGAGCPTDAIIDAVAAGFSFRATDEGDSLYPGDAELARELGAEPVATVVSRVCGLESGDPIDAEILTAILSRLTR